MSVVRTHFWQVVAFLRESSMHKVGFKLNHTGRGKKKCRVRVGDKGTGRDNRQAFGVKKLQITVSDFCTCFHKTFLT